MELAASQKAPKNCPLVHLLFEKESPAAVDHLITEQFKKAHASKEFSGKAGESLFLRSKDSTMLFLGMGKREEFEEDSIRNAAAMAATTLRARGFKALAFANSTGLQKKIGGNAKFALLAAEGCLLALYRFTKYKTGDAAKELKEKEIKSIHFICPAAKVQEVKKSLSYAQAVCSATAIARDISNESGPDAMPQSIARTAASLAKKHGIKCSVLLQKQMEKEKMGGMLSVTAGSDHPPAFLILDYHPRSAQDTICIVGKGVTFDSGGLSIKPSSGMDKMKHDKSGAAAAIGTVIAAASLHLPLRIICLAPLTENVVGGSGTKPGDIITMANGKTVEVLNTDAEGRLILADALHYASHFKPSAIIDLATLTGACVVALGPHAAGLLGNEQWLLDRIKKAGEEAHERTWQLPMWREYGEMMKGEFSDLKNIVGTDAGGGTITAAAFLSNFVEKKIAWAHIDIAGTAYGYSPKGYFAQAGSTGFGVRLLAAMLSKWKKKK
jgi:leucyl aminopeptidase